MPSQEGSALRVWQTNRRKVHVRAPLGLFVLRAGLVFLLISLAGCVSDGPDPNLGKEACLAGICPAEDMPDADFQPGATPLWTVGAGDIRAFARTDDGWAWIRAFENAWWVETLDETEGTLARWLLPQGHVVGSDGLAWADDAVWFIHAPAGARSDGTLTRWVPELGAASWPLPGVPFPTEPLSHRDGAWLLGGLLQNGTTVWEWNTTVQPLADGNGTIVGATYIHAGTLVALVNGTGAQLQWWGPNERFVAFETTDSISGVWGAPFQAAFTVTGETSSLHLYDPFQHKVLDLEFPGENARFGSNNLHFEHAQEGANPVLQTWFPATGVTDGFFLGSPFLWDATEDGLWWLDVPKTDHRFDESANPTPFNLVLLQAS